MKDFPQDLIKTVRNFVVGFKVLEKNKRYFVNNKNEKHGTSREWYSTNQIKTEMYYLFDKKNGTSREYTMNDELLCETFYINDKKQGVLKRFLNFKRNNI